MAKPATDNPWSAAGLEWMTSSPPPTFNFDETPVVNFEAYDYERHRARTEVPVAATSPPRAQNTIRHSGTISPSVAQQKNSASLGMWLFLVTEIMFFGGMFCAYLIYRLAHFNDFCSRESAASTSSLGAGNTVVLLLSSVDGSPGRERCSARKAQTARLLLDRSRSFLGWPSWE